MLSQTSPQESEGVGNTSEIKENLLGKKERSGSADANTKRNYVWIGVPFIGSLQLATYICYYNPQPLQIALLDYPMYLTSAQYNLLFSAFSFPNIFLSLIGGYIIDKKGLKFSLFLYSTLLLLGQVITTIGASVKIYGIMLIGRFICGIGSENLSLAQKVLIGQWFLGSDRVLAYGINTSFAQLGIVLTNAVVPEIYEASPKGDFLYTFLLGTGCALFAEFSSFIITLIDKIVVHRAEENIPTSDVYKKAFISEKIILDSTVEGDTTKTDRPENDDLYVPPIGINYYSSSSSSEDEGEDKGEDQDEEEEEKAEEVRKENYLDDQIVEEKQERKIEGEIEQLPANTPLSFRETVKNFFLNLKSFDTVFWCLIFSNFLGYATFFTLIDNANDILKTNFNYTHLESGELLTIVFLISGVCSPIFGYILKKIGKKILMLMVSLLLFLVGLIILISLHGDFELRRLAPIPWIFFGLFYAMNFGLVWTCISMVVNESKMGSAFGVVYSTRNMNMVLSPLIAGVLRDNEEHQGGYLFVQYYLLIQICIAMILVYIAGMYDKKNKKILL